MQDPYRLAAPGKGNLLTRFELRHVDDDGAELGARTGAGTPRGNERPPIPSAPTAEVVAVKNRRRLASMETDISKPSTCAAAQHHPWALYWREGFWRIRKTLRKVDVPVSTLRSVRGLWYPRRTSILAFAALMRTGREQAGVQQRHLAE
ncbi:MAG: hypothetical protein ACI9W2_004692 [Gammaproteobacteria bacterium]|jgi:hypothetical protein